MNTEIAQDVGNAAAAAPKNDVMTLILCAVVLVVIYFLIIRPNKKRMDEYKKMIDSLKLGNRVMAAGIYGTIKKINKDSIELEVAKNVVIEVNKNAVAGLDKQQD
ncbi:MAG: preprotein translocase subunit YajC [Rickettsiales bacterium]|jgi:preprotein translocase subunit YajC|nr:preprotein translocase subunit YajC [Rickettsiales bacterium]